MAGKYTSKDIKIGFWELPRIDTGWDCCVCGTFASVMGDGFTWCKKHWEEYDLGQGNTIKQMRDKLK